MSGKAEIVALASARAMRVGNPTPKYIQDGRAPCGTPSITTVVERNQADQKRDRKQSDQEQARKQADRERKQTQADQERAEQEQADQKREQANQKREQEQADRERKQKQADMDKKFLHVVADLKGKFRKQCRETRAMYGGLSLYTNMFPIGTAACEKNAAIERVKEAYALCDEAKTIGTQVALDAATDLLDQMLLSLFDTCITRVWPEDRKHESEFKTFNTLLQEATQNVSQRIQESLKIKYGFVLEVGRYKDENQLARDYRKEMDSLMEKAENDVASEGKRIKLQISIRIFEGAVWSQKYDAEREAEAKAIDDFRKQTEQDALEHVNARKKKRAKILNLTRPIAGESVHLQDRRNAVFEAVRSGRPDDLDEAEEVFYHLTRAAEARESRKFRRRMGQGDAGNEMQATQCLEQEPVIAGEQGDAVKDDDEGEVIVWNGGAGEQGDAGKGEDEGEDEVIVWNGGAGCSMP